MTGEVLDDRYRLDRLVAEDGPAMAYEGWDLRLDRRVAVKVIRPRAALSASEREAFLDEARTAAKLNHPHVVALLDAGVAGERPYLVMEFLSGPTLRERLAHGHLPVVKALRVTRGLASALEVAHLRRIFHLEVAPENVLLTENGTARLVDVGIARTMREIPAGKEGQIPRPASYAAPDAVAGRRGDARADVYALGALLYEMLTGEPPFSGTPDEQAEQKAVGEPIPPELLSPAVPPRLGRIVLRALARKPAERFASPGALAAALEEYEAQAEHRTRAFPAIVPTRPRPQRADTPRLIPGARPARPAGTVRTPQSPRRVRRDEVHVVALWFLLVLLLSTGLTALFAITVLPRVSALVPQSALATRVAAAPTEAITIPGTGSAGQGESGAVPAPGVPSPTEAPSQPAAPDGAPVESAPSEVPPEGGPATIRLEDTDWQGGYRRSGRPTVYGGRTATWIYGTSTQYSAMEATFELPAQPVGQASLVVEGMDSEDYSKTPIQIAVNGVEIYNGPNPLPDDDIPLDTGTWATARWEFDAVLLRPGRNTITIRNLAEGAFSLPPFFMLDYAEISYDLP